MEGSFHKLSEDILIHVFSFLNELPNLAVFAQVCHKWRKATNSEKFWSTLHLRNRRLISGFSFLSLASRIKGVSTINLSCCNDIDESSLLYAFLDSEWAKDLVNITFNNVRAASDELLNNISRNVSSKTVTDDYRPRCLSLSNCNGPSLTNAGLRSITSAMLCPLQISTASADPSAVTVCLSGCQWVDDNTATILGSVRNLVSLDLSRCHNVTPAGLTALSVAHGSTLTKLCLAACEKLKIVKQSQQQIATLSAGGEESGTLNAMESLRSRGSDAGSILVSCARMWTDMRHLDLSHIGVTDTLLKAVGVTCTELEILSIPDNELGASSLWFLLHNCQKLRALNVSQPKAAAVVARVLKHERLLDSTRPLSLIMQGCFSSPALASLLSEPVPPSVQLVILSSAELVRRQRTDQLTQLLECSDHFLYEQLESFETPLHIASKEPSPRSLEFLLAECGCDAEVRTRMGSPLETACRLGRYSVIPLLVKYGGKITPKAIREASESGERRTLEAVLRHAPIPLPDSVSFESCVQMGHSNLARVLLAHGFIVSKDAVMVAARAGHLDLVQGLLEMHAAQQQQQQMPTPASAPSSLLDESLLFEAIVSGNFELTRMLIFQGCLEFALNNHQALFLALRHRKLDIFRYLTGRFLTDFSILNQRYFFDGPRHAYVLLSPTESIEDALARMNLGSRVTREAVVETLLHFAVRDHFLESVEYVLACPAVNPNVTNQAGDTPLHVAVRELQYGIVEALVQSGASMMAVNEKSGETPFSMATDAKDVQMLVRLLAGPGNAEAVPEDPETTPNEQDS